MAGERGEAAPFEPPGTAGDRVHAVLHEHKGEWRPLTAREAPRLLAWRASYPFAPDATVRSENPPLAQVTEPGGRRAWRWDDPRFLRALREDLGREVRLARDPAGIQDLERSVLLTVEATRGALGEELGAELDLRRFRTNVHLELDAPPWGEHDWEGGTLRFAGGAVLQLLHPCIRCAIPTRDPVTQEKWPELAAHLEARHGRMFGINARVVQSGRVSVAEPVDVELPGPRG